MEEIEFTDKELAYIKADIHDETQDIYISGIARIKASLPKGKYCILVDDIDDRLYMCDDLMAYYDISAIPKIANDDLKFLHKFCYTCTAPGVTFNVHSNMSIEFSLIHERPEHFAHIIHTLRKQAIYNSKLTQESLIQQDIKFHTDLGEEYNRQSFEDAILDYFNDDEDLMVDTSKSIKDKDVKYLQLMKLMQDKNRHEIKQQQLDMEATELAIRENKLMR